HRVWYGRYWDVQPLPGQVHQVLQPELETRSVRGQHADADDLQLDRPAERWEHDPAHRGSRSADGVSEHRRHDESDPPGDRGSAVDGGHHYEQLPEGHRELLL